MSWYTSEIWTKTPPLSIKRLAPPKRPFNQHQNTPFTNTPPPPKHPFHQHTSSTETPLPPKRPLHQNAPSTKTPPPSIKRLAPPKRPFNQHQNTPSTFHQNAPSTKILLPLHPLKGSLHQNAPSTSTKTPSPPTHLLHLRSSNYVALLSFQTLFSNLLRSFRNHFRIAMTQHSNSERAGL